MNRLLCEGRKFQEARKTKRARSLILEKMIFVFKDCVWAFHGESVDEWVVGVIKPSFHSPRERIGSVQNIKNRHPACSCYDFHSLSVR